MIKFIKLIIAIAMLYGFVNTVWNLWVSNTKITPESASCLMDTVEVMDLYAGAYFAWYDGAETATDTDDIIALLGNFRKTVDETGSPRCAFSENDRPAELGPREWDNLFEAVPRARQAALTFIDSMEECLLLSDIDDLCLDKTAAHEEEFQEIVVRFEELMVKGRFWESQ